MLRSPAVAMLVLGLVAACFETPAQDAPPAKAAAEKPAAGKDWPVFRGNPALQGVAQGELADDPQLRWTFDTGGEILSSPVIAGGTVYVGSCDGSVYALDLTTGNKRWSFATKDMIEAPPLVHAGRV
jgi:outer membrane protein assembly factor BamB